MKFESQSVQTPIIKSGLLHTQMHNTLLEETGDQLLVEQSQLGLLYIF